MVQSIFVLVLFFGLPLSLIIYLFVTKRLQLKSVATVFVFSLITWLGANILNKIFNILYFHYFYPNSKSGESNFDIFFLLVSEIPVLIIYFIFMLIIYGLTKSVFKFKLWTSLILLSTGILLVYSVVTINGSLDAEGYLLRFVAFAIYIVLIWIVKISPKTMDTLLEGRDDILDA